MPVVTQLIIKVNTEGGDKAKSTLTGIHGEADKSPGIFGKATAGLAGFVAGGAALSLVKGGVDLVTGALGELVSQAETSEAVQAQTSAVLQATHMAAGMTADSVSNLATKLSNLTGVDDEAVQSGENMLLTFRHIGSKGGIFDQASAMALDMAQTFHTGPEQAALQLGKALDNPTTGFARLQKIGVTFSQHQIDLIKHFQATGQMAKAQQVILDELGNEMGGAASAHAHTLQGAMQLLNTQWGNFQEAVGGAVIPAITELASHLGPIVSTLMEGLQPALDDVSGFLGSAADNFGTFAQGLLTGKGPMTVVTGALSQLGQIVGTVIIPGAQKLATWFTGHVLPVLGQIAGIVVGSVLPALGNLGSVVLGQLVPAVQNLWNILAPQVVPVLQLVGNVISGVVAPALGGLLTAVAAVINFIASNEGVFKTLEITLGIVGAFILASLVPAFVGWAISAGAAAIATIAATWPILAVIAVIALLVGAIIAVVSHWDDITSALGRFKDLVATATVAAFKMIGDGLGHLGEWLGETLGKIGDFIGGAIGFFSSLPNRVLAFITQLALQLLLKIGTMELEALAKVGSLVSGIIGFFQSLPGKAGALLQGLITVALGKISELQDTFRRGLDAVTGIFKSLKIPFPHIPLPHFSINGDFSINPPHVPSFGVNWYGTGGVFLHPSVIGVGDRPEAVIPLDRLADIIAGRDKSFGGGGGQGGRQFNITVNGSNMGPAELVDELQWQELLHG
jgi:hypothetical protein